VLEPSEELGERGLVFERVECHREGDDRVDVLGPVRLVDAPAVEESAQVRLLGDAYQP
jgi:hypothetical protein